MDPASAWRRRFHGLHLEVPIEVRDQRRGDDHVGIGTDASVALWSGRRSSEPHEVLGGMLAARGHSDKVFGGNFARVMREIFGMSFTLESLRK